ncbi:MAG TPA: hypothetical protein VHB77_21450, partial [Planctomycetaceae bacterium]|nr:hypothetical protein [Planctomycetaceae bacterium]
MSQSLVEDETGEEVAASLRAEQFHTAWPGIAKLFDYLEANAGSYWQAPRLPGSESAALPRSLDPDFEDDLDDEDDDENELFSAAYDNVVYRDSAHDGILGDTVDSGGLTPHETDIDQLADDVEGRLRFHVTLARLWELAASVYASRPQPAEGAKDVDPSPVQRWYDHLQTLLPELLGLLQAASLLELPAPSGDHDSLVEYDRLLQVKYNLVHNIVYTHVACRQAAWQLAASLPEPPPAEGLPPWEQQTIVLFRAILRGDAKDVRNELPTLLQALVRQPLLYVPLDKGGEPAQLLRARTVQAVLRWLMSQLPYLGLFRQTWHVLRTAQRMERHSPHADMVITEFDRLFYAALRSSLRALIRQAEHWKAKPFDDERLIDMVGTITDHYLAPWLEHSATMRLSTLEALSDPEVWDDVQQFIQNYGNDLLQSPVLTLGNLRGILHNGVGAYLDYLIENEDPLHPVKLLTDLDVEIARDDAESLLELIYRATVEKYDRYL